MDGRASPRCGGLDLIYRGIFSLFDFSGSDWRWDDRVVFLFLGLREIFFENSFISFVIFFAFLNECDRGNRGGLSIEKERKNKEEEEDRFGKFLDRKIRLLAF